MLKHRILAVSIAFTLVLGVTALWSAETNERDGDTDANIVSDAGSLTGESEDVKSTERKKGGNRFARFFKKPFKAVGKLFARGRDDNDKLQRMTEKDVSKFEVTGLARVDDSRSEKRVPPSASGTAREHLTTGRALLLANRVNEAIAELSLAASLDPNLSETNSLLGVAFDRKGMHERAKDAYERAIKREPEDAQTLNNLGFSLYQNGNYRAAVDRLKRAARLAPKDQRILNNLALAQCRLGKHEDAYKNFARAGGELVGRLNTAAILERQGYDSEAIKYYEAARRTNPDSSVTLRRLAELYRRVGRYEDAQAAQRDFSRLANDMTATHAGN